MKTYIVTASRTEEITFEVQADSQADAEERYLSDGDEIASRTTDLTVVDTEEAR